MCDDAWVRIAKKEKKREERRWEAGAVVPGNACDPLDLTKD